MKVSKESQRIARQLFRVTVADGKMDAGVAEKIISKIKSSKPRNYLQILHSYHHLLKLEARKRHAVIESAEALSKGTETNVLRDLQKKYGEDLTSEFVVNPDLIGGMRVKVGSDVWDGSVRSRLESLRDRLSA